MKNVTTQAHQKISYIPGIRPKEHFWINFETFEIFIAQRIKGFKNTVVPDDSGPIFQAESWDEACYLVSQWTREIPKISKPNTRENLAKSKTRKSKKEPFDFKTPQRKSKRPIRLCAYQGHWLIDFPWDFGDNAQLVHYSLNNQMEEDVLIWSTGESSKKGDVQIFCFSKEFSAIKHLLSKNKTSIEADIKKAIEKHPCADAVGSIWQLISDPDPRLAYGEWHTRAKFKLLVALDTPVPKRNLIEASIINPKYPKWPMNRRGKLLKKEDDIRTLAQVLVECNPNQSKEIWKALGF